MARPVFYINEADKHTICPKAVNKGLACLDLHISVGVEYLASDYCFGTYHQSPKGKHSNFSGQLVKATFIGNKQSKSSINGNQQILNHIGEKKKPPGKIVELF